jgi:hypothetical protein
MEFWRGEPEDVVTSFLFLVLLPDAKLRLAVGGRPSGLYCVPASTYPVVPAAARIALVSTADLLLGWCEDCFGL